VAEAAHLKGKAIIDAEVICEVDGVADFDVLQGRTKDHEAIAVAFDLLSRDGEDLRPKPLVPLHRDYDSLDWMTGCG
jgi:ATP-dependent DNA ligase